MSNRINVAASPLKDGGLYILSHTDEGYVMLRWSAAASCWTPLVPTSGVFADGYSYVAAVTLPEDVSYEPLFSVEVLSSIASLVGSDEFGPNSRNWSFNEGQLTKFAQYLNRLQVSKPTHLTGHINIDANTILATHPKEALSAVLSFLHQLDDPVDVQTFLNLWYEGSFSELKRLFPEYDPLSI